ncbi:MAG: response regulator [Chloroflexi bacterium]|nr:MAG: response regulator [Chloroflexota bacterium]
MRASAPVLVVEDDASILDVVRSALEAEGYDVRTATNGKEGLERLADGKVSLVLLDMRMPVLDGWQFAKELKRRAIDVPVVVMTAAQNARHWAEEIGADAYLSKPFDLDDLLAAVARHRDS